MADPEYPNDSPELAAFRKANQSFVDKWKVAGPLKAKIREERIRAADTVQAMRVLDGLDADAVARGRPDRPCGLIEMHRLLSKLSDRGGQP